MPVVIDADETQRAALSEVHALASVERFHAELLVSPWNRNGVRVEGKVAADIVQECIVTLEPLAAHIAEAVSAVYLPEDSKLGREGFGAGGEILIEIDGPDSPETFTGDSIDVGALAEEFFGLAINPYPRKGDVSLDVVRPDLLPEPEENALQKKLKALTGKS